MTKMILWMSLIVLAFGIPGAVRAGDGGAAAAGEGTVQPAVSSPSSAVEAVSLPGQPALDLVFASSCSAVCTQFHAATYDDCTDLNCYALGCGAPNGFDWGTCTCSCSYCF